MTRLNRVGQTSHTEPRILPNILIQGQQAWENYIQIYYKLEGAAIGSPIYGYCPIGKAIDRVTQLQHLLVEI